MGCQKCGEETFLPFQCIYCGGQFCAAHRLPENHDCPKLRLARAPRQEDAGVFRTPSSYEYTVTFGQPRRAKGRIHFSSKELKHLAVGTLLVVGVGLSFGVGALEQPDWLFVLPAVAFIITASFFAHELAHKFIAQRQGLWAEFRLTMWGAVLTLFSMLLPFKIISPGAVMVSGAAGLREIGRVSVAGPVTNLVLSVIFFGLTFAPTEYSWIFAIGAFFNAYIAAFNLLPVGILDGYKIFSWSRKVWVLVFAVAAALTVISGFFVY